MAEIPKIIWQMWLGGPLPEEYSLYCLRWSQLHPGWECKFLTEESLWSMTFYNSLPLGSIKKISPKAAYQLASDIVRYELLMRYGGVWVDVDMDPQYPIDDLCKGTDSWIAWEEEGVWVNNAIMAAAPGTDWMKEAVFSLAENIDKIDRAHGNTHKSGPQYLTPITLRHDVKIYPKSYFYPYLWNELDREHEKFPHAYAVHRWNNRRKRRR